MSNRVREGELLWLSMQPAKGMLSARRPSENMTHSIDSLDIRLIVIFISIYPATDLLEFVDRRPRDTTRKPHFEGCSSLPTSDSKWSGKILVLMNETRGALRYYRGLS